MSLPNPTYSFFPYIRKGVTGKIVEQDDLGKSTSYALSADPEHDKRAKLDVNLYLNEATSPSVSKQVFLVGARDVTGIDPKHIIRLCPNDGETGFLPNYLAFVDFYDEDFPWRFTPATATKDGQTEAQYLKLRPWLTLVVLTEDEFDELILTDSPCQGIKIKESPSKLFPNEEQIWAWAHVQVNESIGSGNADFDSSLQSATENFLANYPDMACSRIICPRRLLDNTTYYAFLIPSFEAARLTALGQDDADIHKFEPAWKHSQTTGYTTDYPYYFRWQFTTGTAGDFESLVRKLQPSVPSPQLGKMPMDISMPNHPWLDNLAMPPIIEFEGILQQAAADSTNTPNVSADFKEAMEDLLNLPDDLQQLGVTQDPVITAPLYGRWHALVSRIDYTNVWMEELNLDPKYRVAAGMGAEVIRANQDQYLEMAWNQVNAVKEANRKLALQQAAQLIALANYNKNFATRTDSDYTGITNGAHSKILGAGSNTVYVNIKDSNVPVAMTDSAFRSQTRPGSSASKVSGLFSSGGDLSYIASVAGSSVTTVAPYTTSSHLSLLTAISSTNFTSSAVNGMSPVNNFVLTKPGGGLPSSWSTGGADDATMADCRTAYSSVLLAKSDTVSAYTTESSATALNVTNARAGIGSAIHPDNAYSEHATNIVKVDGNKLVQPAGSINLPMAAPVIDIPMYKPLLALAPDFLIPNFHLVAENSVTLLETNPKFIESYMLGLNYEMARELIWNEYPTDQRGSYFRNFWDSNVVFPDLNQQTGGELTDQEKADLEKERDIKPIDQWTKSSTLGSHNNGMNSATAQLVLVIKGEIIKKFPNMLIYAQKAKWQLDNANTPIQGESRILDDNYIKQPAFFATADPDVLFVGFDLSIAETKGVIPPDNSNPGWFFVMQEKAGDIRFGLDVPPSSHSFNRPADWDHLDWAYLSNLTGLDYSDVNLIDLVENKPPDPLSVGQIIWGNNSANMSYIFCKKPVKIAIHGSNLLASV